MADENDDRMQAVKLDAPNKEHQSLVATGRQLQSTLVWELVLSAATVAILTGSVTIGPEITLGGITLSAPRPESLLLILAFVVTVLFWRWGSLQLHGIQRCQNIRTLYDELGYREHIDRAGFHSLVYPDLSEVLSALDDKASDYFAGVFRERPIKRTLRGFLTTVCWLITYVDAFGLALLVLLVPPILDILVSMYERQHNVSGATITVFVIVTALLYVAGLWMGALAIDKRELARTFEKPAAALQEYVASTQAEKGPATNSIATKTDA